MSKRTGLGITIAISIIVATAAALFIIFKVDFLLLPPKEKFAQTWTSDVHVLEQTKKLPVQWNEIREITLKTDNSPAQDWIVNLKNPIRTNPNGEYKLDIFIIHWIEGIRYGAVVQYNLIDLKNNNTVWELGRTFKLGYVY